MIANLTVDHKNYRVNLAQPLDISITLTNTAENPIAWYLDQPVIEPVRFGDWVGKVSEGKSSTNFNNIFFNPHGHGTHTECLGHITHDFYSVNEALQAFFFMAELVSIAPEWITEDWIITRRQLEKALAGKKPQAIVIRTLPNEIQKLHMNYSNTNPPYLEDAAARYLREIGIEHLLIDLPSVDKEYDEGQLLAHKAFWNVTDVKQLNADARLHATITEMIFVPDHIPDGTYLLNLQLASFENDASPSKPVLYALQS